MLGGRRARDPVTSSMSIRSAQAVRAPARSWGRGRITERSSSRCRDVLFLSQGSASTMVSFNALPRHEAPEEQQQG